MSHPAAAEIARVFRPAQAGVMEKKVARLPAAGSRVIITSHASPPIQVKAIMRGGSACVTVSVQRLPILA